MKRVEGAFDLARCCFLPILLLVFSQSAAASSLRPVLDLTGGGFATVPLADAVGGWQFHSDSSLTIGAIGLWDEGGLPLQIAHDVGLWKSDGMLLISAIVSNSSVAVASASLEGRWLFTPIVPITLEPGDYVMGAVWGDPIIGADPFRLDATAISSSVSYSGPCSKTLLPGPELVFPDCGAGPPDRASFFGPNLAVVVPEPSTIPMFVLGLLAAAGDLRRRLKH